MPEISIELESLPSGAEDGVDLVSEDSEAYEELSETSEDGEEASGFDAHLREEYRDLERGLRRRQRILNLDELMDATMNLDHDEVTGIHSDRLTYGEGNERELQRIRETLEGIRQNSAPREKRWYQRVKFWSFILGTTIAAGSVAVILIYYIVRDYVVKPEKGAKGLTEKQKKLVKKKVARWKSMSYEEYWSHIADYMDKWNPSWAAQLLWMTYTKQLKPLKECTPSKWHFASEHDEVDLAEKCANAYAESKKVGDIYRTVAALKYAGDPDQKGKKVLLPRFVAAQVCETAIGWMIVNEHGKGN